MQTLPAQEIKRRGVAAFDEILKEGPIQIIRNNIPQYVVLSLEQFQDMKEAEEEALIHRVRASLEDVKAGRVKRFKSAQSLIEEFGLDK